MVAPTGAPRRGVCTGPRPRALGGTAQDWALPLGQAEDGRTQYSKDVPATGRPELFRSAAATPEHPGPCGLGAMVLTAELTPGLESWPPPLWLFLLGPHGVNNPH